MTNIYMIQGEEKTYKELQAMAKELGIKANQKGDVLEMRINEALTQEVVYENDLTEEEIDRIFGLNEEPCASEASAPIQQTPPSEPKASNSTKLFTFVQASNTHVIFMQKNIRVAIAWSKKDGRCYKYVNSKCDPMTPQEAIRKLAPYKDGVHGDVARMMAALQHIAQKPAIIRAYEEYAKKNESVSRSAGKENAPTLRRKTYQPICMVWHAKYKQQMGDAYDVVQVGDAFREALANGYVPVQR